MARLHKTTVDFMKKPVLIHKRNWIGAEGLCILWAILYLTAILITGLT